MFTADSLYNALMLDIWPSAGALVDFGLDKPKTRQRLYEAYQKAVRSGKITLSDLRKASGDGNALSKLIGERVHTIYDLIGMLESGADDSDE